MQRNLILILSLLIAASMSGCKNETAEEEFKKLFDGFQLRLVDSWPEGISAQEIDSSTLKNRFPAERTLIPGHVYVFQKTTALSEQELAMTVFPKRLTSIGARVTKAPQSEGDFMYLYIGGPLYNIQFEKDGHRGTIFNQSHISNTPGQSWEELIVVYK